MFVILRTSVCNSLCRRSHACIYHPRMQLSSSPRETIMNVFDRKSKNIQKDRTALLQNYKDFDYIRDEVGYRLADRISDVKRKFEVAADIGCWRGHVARHIYDDMVGKLYMYESSEEVLKQADISPEVETVKVLADEEYIPLETNSLDLVVSSLSLHWINNLPGLFKTIQSSLKNDGCFIGAMFGGDTLYELRVALQLAETEKEGGFGVHISPFTTVQDLGNLLNRAGFTMLTIDIDELVINFPSIYELMRDLKGMGENNASHRRKAMLRRDTQKRASEIYKEMYGNKEDDTIPATFQVINFIAWKPDKSQRKPAERGSQSISIKDIDKLDQLTEQIDKARDQLGGHEYSSALNKISDDIESLRQKTIDNWDNLESPDDGGNKDGKS